MSGRRRFLFLIPAHNETGIIQRTVQSALAVDWPADHRRVVVLADNCSDTTAEESRQAGAEVLERFNTEERGKGFALEFALGKFLKDPEYATIDAFVIVDADSTMDSSILQSFSDAINSGAAFMQCYDTVGNAEASWRTELLTYAFALFNGTYLKGLCHSGLGAHLRGNGMCFTREGLQRNPWKAASLAEDLEFSWRLRLAGERVRFVDQSSVFAEMPATQQASKSQRSRWESGRQGLKSIMTGPTWQQSASILTRIKWLLDLWMPPLSIAALALGLAGFIIALQAVSGDVPGTLLTLWLMNTLFLGTYLLSPFFVMKLPLRFLKSLLFGPYYAIWRLTVMAAKAPQTWIRTTREK